MKQFDSYEFNLTLHLYKSQLTEIDRRLSVFNEMQLKANSLYDKLKHKANVYSELVKNMHLYKN